MAGSFSDPLLIRTRGNLSRISSRVRPAVHEKGAGLRVGAQEIKQEKLANQSWSNKQIKFPPQ
jgi:hypothetical protein